ncbi:MAG: recombinase family protein [Christensenellaceae bacterium]
MEEYQPSSRFNEELFEQIVPKIIVDDSTKITFHLLGGLELTQEINEKAGAKSYEKQKCTLWLYVYRGELVLHSQESVIVSEIFQQYLAGKSLLKISEELNEKGIEYRKGITDWNKARLKRILEDERYLGKGGYPIIIQEETYQKAQELKNAKNTQKNIDKKAAIFQVNVPVRCPNCHNKMCRKFDHRFKNKVKWRCQSKTCETLIFKEDTELVQDITELLNEVMVNPEKLQVPIETEREPSRELRILDNEIARMFDRIDIDKKNYKKAAKIRVAPLHRT